MYDPNAYVFNLNDDQLETIDLNVKNNCCNCVSFSVYSDIYGNLYNISEYNYGMYGNLLRYLKCIYISTLNIIKYFKTFIVRIYLDYLILHVIDSIKTYKCTDYDNLINEMINILEILFKNENVEIYYVECGEYDDIFNDNSRCKEEVGIERFFRFLPLIDDDVNILICRDADGIVTFNECKNIENFINSKYLIYQMASHALNIRDKYDVKEEYIEKNENIYNFNYSNSYSDWIKKYRQNQKSFYTNNVCLMNMLAGLLSFKIKISKTAFVKSLKESFEIMINMNIKLFATDEVFLAHLFRHFTCLQIKDKVPINMQKFHDIVLYPFYDDYKKIELNNDDVGYQNFIKDKDLLTFFGLRDDQLFSLNLKDYYNIIHTDIININTRHSDNLTEIVGRGDLISNFSNINTDVHKINVISKLYLTL